jgi:16S rRNA processing protein RimM
MTVDKETELVELGSINGVFGVQGWVKVFSHTSPRIQITDYRRWVLRQHGQETECKVLRGRVQGKSIVAQLDTIADRNQAEAMIGAVIYVHSDQLEVLAEGEYYWSQLVGLKVCTLDNVDLGVVDWLFETGNNDVMVVAGDRERFIPYVKGDFVKEVDLEAGKIVVDWDPDF